MFTNNSSIRIFIISSVYRKSYSLSLKMVEVLRSRMVSVRAVKNLPALINRFFMPFLIYLNIFR